MENDLFQNEIKPLIDEYVRIVPYDPEWPTNFTKEKSRLARELSDSSLTFEHIGSTSIPGSPSKEIIDIMIGVENYPPSPAWVTKLCLLRYFYHGEAGICGRLHFTQRGEKNYNLAVVLLNGQHWKLNLKFRNFLRNHPEERQEYEKVKMRAIESGATRLISYSDFKKDFIKSIFQK